MILGFSFVGLRNAPIWRFLGPNSPILQVLGGENNTLDSLGFRVLTIWKVLCRAGKEV